ncbi:MAG: hypothetical protein EOP10_05305 [Proteobacteria bacterium]|nr:MAG: hypothetical protein EOP10_05305 [Pseudomonadota bacterium]
MRPRLRFRSEDGTSLVELIIAVAIGSIVIGGIFMFIGRINQGQAVSRARDLSKKTNQQILDILKRDFTYQLTLDPSKKPFHFKVGRKEVFQKGIPSASFDVSYESVCTKIQGSNEKANLLRTIYGRDNTQTFAKSSAHCLLTLKCPAQTIPQIKIISNSKTVTYSATDFPLLDKDYQSLTTSQPIGSALCYKVKDNQYQMVIESLFVNDPKALTLSLVADEILLRPTGISNIDLVPPK